MLLSNSAYLIPRLPRPARALRLAAPQAWRLLAPLMLLAVAVTHADAQMPRSSTQSSIVVWMPGDASHNGYEHVSGWFDYYFAPCVGSSITAQLTLRPEVTAAPIYWYRGKRHPLTTQQDEMFDQVRPTRVDMVANLNATQPKELTAFEPSSGSCQGWQIVASQRDYYPEKATREEAADALNRLTIANGTSRQPLRNSRLEQLLDQEVAQARRDSMDRVSAARADTENRARLARAKQDSLARARTTATAGTGAAGAGAAGGASGRTSSSGRSGSSTSAPAQTQAERQAAAQAHGDSVRQMLEEQQARRAAEEQATTAAVSTAVTTTFGLAQAMGSMVGGYYLMGEEPPANSSYKVQSMSGIGGGLSGKWMYLDAGMISMTLTDSYITKAKARDGYAPDKDQTGYFMSGGLSLEMPWTGESAFAFAPSLGYTYIENSADVPVGGVHAGFGVRLGSFKVRVDMGSGDFGATYGIGGYIKF